MNSKYRDENGVLYNKLGITDREVLNHVEYEYSLLKAEGLMPDSLTTRSTFGLEKLKEIHKELFGGIYEWAGSVRETPSGKWDSLSKTATSFVSPEDIPSAWEKIESSINKYLDSPTYTIEESRKALLDIFIDANHAHVFVEGNGRALQVFMSQLAQEKDINIDFSKTDREVWNMACALSAPHFKIYDRIHRIPQEPNTAPLEKIFQDIVSPHIGHSVHKENSSPDLPLLKELELKYKENLHLLSPKQKQVAAAAHQVFQDLPPDVQNRAKINLYQNQLAEISHEKHTQKTDGYGPER